MSCSATIPALLHTAAVLWVYFAAGTYLVWLFGVNTHRHAHTFCSMSLCTHQYSHGMSRSGTEYGALTDLPDWSYIGM